MLTKYVLIGLYGHRWQPIKDNLSYRKAVKFRKALVSHHRGVRSGRYEDHYLVIDEKTWNVYIELWKEIDSL